MFFYLNIGGFLHADGTAGAEYRNILLNSSLIHEDTFGVSESGGTVTLKETNISHFGRRKIIFKSALVGDMLLP